MAKLSLGISCYLGAGVALTLFSCSQKYDLGVHADSLSAKDKDVSEVICDPLSGGGQKQGGARSGLYGSLFHSPPNVVKGSMTIEKIFKGNKAPAALFMSQLNIPTRSFDTGFPASDGKLLSDNNGNTLVEWFGISMNTNLIASQKFPANNYQLGVFSDDGSIIYRRETNGTLTTILNHDGEHSPSARCATSPIFLSSTPVPLRIDYFQGPKTQIALVLKIRPVGTSIDSTCTSPDWGVIPPENFQLDAEVPDNLCQ